MGWNGSEKNSGCFVSKAPVNSVSLFLGVILIYIFLQRDVKENKDFISFAFTKKNQPYIRNVSTHKVSGSKELRDYSFLSGQSV